MTVKGLLPGDVGVVGTPHAMSKGILTVERFWSLDGEALYGHAFIITSEHGNTLESLWTFKEGHISSYLDDRLMIARPTNTVSDLPLRPTDKQLAIQQMIRQHYGQKYPAWRLMLHLIPPLARKTGRGNFLVCSEAVAKYLWLIGARGTPYLGVNPDNLADEWRHWRNFKIIYTQEAKHDQITNDGKRTDSKYRLCPV